MKIKNSSVEELRYLRDRERNMIAGADIGGRLFPFNCYNELKKDGFIAVHYTTKGEPMFILSFLGHTVLAAHEENADRQTI